MRRKTIKIYAAVNKIGDSADGKRNVFQVPEFGSKFANRCRL